MLSFYVKAQNKVANLLRREEGQGMVEYAMIIGLVAVGVIALVTILGNQVTGIFDKITTALVGPSGVAKP